jgi:hypothetical protein
MYGDGSRPVVSKEIPVCNLCYERMGSPKTLEEFAHQCYFPVPEEGRVDAINFLGYCINAFGTGHPVRVAARKACNRFIAEMCPLKGKAA